MIISKKHIGTITHNHKKPVIWTYRCVLPKTQFKLIMLVKDTYMTREIHKINCTLTGHGKTNFWSTSNFSISNTVTIESLLDAIRRVAPLQFQIWNIKTPDYLQHLRKIMKLLHVIPAIFIYFNSICNAILIKSDSSTEWHPRTIQKLCQKIQMFQK